jgi:hypothetical protein
MTIVVTAKNLEQSRRFLAVTIRKVSKIWLQNSPNF